MSKIFKFSNLVVLLVIGLNVWFTDRALDAFVITGTESPVLTGAFFAFTTGELWLLASIKKNKINGVAPRKFRLKFSKKSKETQNTENN